MKGLDETGTSTKVAKTVNYATSFCRQVCLPLNIQCYIVPVFLISSIRHPFEVLSTVFQFAIVSKRSWQSMIRNRHTFSTQVSHNHSPFIIHAFRCHSPHDSDICLPFQIISAIILGLLIGALYFQIDDSATSGIQNRYVHPQHF